MKSAFDIANRDIVLYQLIAFDVKGNLLRWIRGYLRVLFNGALNTAKELEFGTPRGGMLSPFLFNILFRRLLSLLPNADDTIHAFTQDLQTTCNVSLTPSMNQHPLVVSLSPKKRVEFSPPVQGGICLNFP